MNDANLPDGWTATQLRTVLAHGLMNGRSVPTADKGFPVLRLTALNGGVIDLSECKIGKWERTDAVKYLVREGDFLVSRGNGSIRLVGRGGLVPRDEEVAFPDTMIRVRPLADAMKPQFLRYQWDAPATRSQIERAAKTTAGIHKVNQRDLERVRLLLAPLPEQQRIVDEIEKHFSRLDDAVATLKQVQAKLKRARASVLKAAVEGRLVPTEAALAKAEGRTYEPAAELLKRILAERKRKHDEEQAGAKRKKTYKPPVEPDTAGLPELPEGWAWARCEAVCERVTVGHVGSMKNEYQDAGVPFLRGQNVRENRYDPTGLKFISEAFHTKLAKSRIVAGDILVTRSGTVGTACVLPDTMPEANCSDLVLVQRPFINSNYGAIYINTAKAIVEKGKVGVALTHFNTKSVAAMPVPLPPLAEQERIVAEVERRLSVLDAADQAVERNLIRCANLRQSILKRAFEGKLVPQDPSDEPASALLARIQAQSA